MTIQKLIELLQTHDDQQREVEIVLTDDQVLPVDIEFTLDGDVYLTTNEIK